MILFRRRQKIESPPPRLPDLYVSSYQGLRQYTLRYFVVEPMWHDDTREEVDGMLTMSSGRPYPNVRELLNELRELTQAASINPHKYYIAIHWMADRPPSDDTQAAIVARLAQHFGWEDPLIDSFEYPSDKMHEIERRRGVNWSPST